MSLISEKKIIREWLCKQSARNNEWDSFYDEVDSYWSVREKTDGIEVYDISSLSEIQNALKNLWKNEDEFYEIEKVLSVAALKSCKDEREEKIYLSDYVYIF